MSQAPKPSPVQEAVQPAPPDLAWFPVKVDFYIPHLRWIVAGLVLVTATVTSLMLLSNNGDWRLLEQRLFGQVQLSTGTYGVHSVADLNRVSWQWGLDTMDAMDRLSRVLTQTETLLATPTASTQDLRAAQKQLRLAQVQLQTQLDDKSQLLQVAHVFGQDQLYAPEYADSLFTLQSRTAEVKTQLNKALEAESVK